MLTPEGMVRNVSGSWVRQYNLTDHLGNTRVVLEPSGTVLQQTDYNPFGTAFVVSNTTKNKYLYGSKELQDEVIGGEQLNLADFEARFLDSRIPRFTSIDQLAEKYYSFSPYAYCLNNPILYIDPDGRSIDLSWLLQIDKDHGTNYTQMLLDDWSSQTGLTFTYSISDGILSYDADNGNAIVGVDDNGVEIGSATARDFLIDAIDHPDVVSFTGGPQTQVRPIGSNVIITSPNEINGYINGAVGVDNRTFGWGMIMMHELHHTGVGGSMSDTPYSDTYPGDVVTQMNVIRGELNAKGANYGQRKSYESIGNDGLGYFLPFDNISKAAIDRGLVPVQPMPGQSNIKYIKH